MCLLSCVGGRGLPVRALGRGSTFWGMSGAGARAAQPRRKRAAGGGGVNGGAKRRKRGGGAEDPSLEYIAAPLSAPLVLAAKAHFQSLGFGLGSFKVVLGPMQGWRTVAKLAVRGVGEGNLILPNQSIGLFAPGSHNIVPCCDSSVHHPAINKAARLCEQVFVSSSVTGYSEERDAGLVRYLLFSVCIDTARVQLTIVVNLSPGQAAPGKFDEAIAALCSHQDVLHSCWVHYHPASRHNNAITGRMDDSWVCRVGNPDLAVRLETTPRRPTDGPRLFFPPNVFRQANVTAFAKIVDAIRLFVPAKSKIIELYAGVGTIGLNLLDCGLRVKKLECSDENPYNELCFNKSVADLREKYQKRVKYITASASKRALSGVFRKFNLLIVDPPRKGLDEEVVQELLTPSAPHKKNRLSRVIYVSCGFKAFARDCARLLAGGFKIVHAEGHVLFPGSDHIETLCVFDRVVMSD